MTNFKDFFNGNENKLQVSSLELAKKINSSLVITQSLGLSRNDEEKFSNEVANLACSDEVLTELNDKIGIVNDTESEEEFVKRAKLSLANILRKKLFK